MKEYTHDKTGEKYMFQSLAVNTTNGQDGKIMVIYSKDKQIFCREYSEFMEKFSASGKEKYDSKNEIF